MWCGLPPVKRGKKRAKKGESSRAEVFGETTTDRSGLLCVRWQSNLGLDTTAQTCTIFDSCPISSFR